MLRILGLITIGLCVAFILPTKPNMIEQVGSKEVDFRNTITQEEIIALTDEFINILIQGTKSNYEVNTFQNKDSLLKEFTKVTTETVAKAYVDYYFYEEDDNLYIVPTETPPWFVKQNDYDVVQLEHNKLMVIQENHSELYGNYKIQLEFTYNDHKWKITNILHQ
ncbi:hypothetical protein [Ornithinibacillus halotolerans]|uniref:Uncharacterized protein n=1 Tax=Ornithinibacillus halotolerans TaxID=1274357 RepID=A0A916RYD5_9BACI|nr:hypothetical protein [Ornithinibacillus halotolerans]GGA76423.1 hypothetical protein GCM10008025_20040 [Ornithinibacillus halotolerans]